MSVIFRPAEVSRPADLALRALLVVAAAAAVVLGAPAWARTPLTALAAVAVVHAFVRRHPEGGRAAAIQVTVGGVLLLLAVGLVLALLPGAQLTRVGWGIGTGVAALGVLLAVARRTPRPRPPAERTRILRLTPWYLGAALVVGVGLTLSILQVRDSDVPPAELSAARTADGSVDVTVTAAQPVGPVELRLEQPDGAGDLVLRDAFTLTAGETVSTPVPDIGDNTVRVVLADADTGTQLRYVIVNPHVES